MYYDKENRKEISRDEAYDAVSASGFDGDIDGYLDEIEDGKYGEHCQAGCNAYWTSDEDFDPEAE